MDYMLLSKIVHHLERAVDCYRDNTYLENKLIRKQLEISETTHEILKIQLKQLNEINKTLE